MTEIRPERSKSDGSSREASSAAPSGRTWPHQTQGSRTYIRHTLEQVHAALAAVPDRVGAARAMVAREGDGTQPLLSVADREQLRRLYAQLRQAVDAYSLHLRTENVPPERMLLLVKSAIAEAIPPELGAVHARWMMEDVIVWSLDAYYRRVDD